MKRHSPTNRTLAALAWLTVACALGALSSARAGAADATTAKLQAIDVQTLPGQQLQLTMRLSGPAPQPLSFTIEKPNHFFTKNSAPLRLWIVQIRKDVMSASLLFVGWRSCQVL